MDGICKHCLKAIRKCDQPQETYFRFAYIHCGSRFGCFGHPADGPNAVVAEPLTLEEVNKQLSNLLLQNVIPISNR